MTAYRPTIYIAGSVHRELLWFAHNYSKEMAAIGEVDILNTGDILISNLYYPKQETSTSTVNIDGAKGWVPIRKDCPPEKRNKLKCHIHKHPGSAFFSGTDDEDTIDSFMEDTTEIEKDGKTTKIRKWMRNFYLFIVFAKKTGSKTELEYCPRIELRSNPITATISEKEIEVKVLPTVDVPKISKIQEKIEILQENLAKEEEKINEQLTKKLDKIKEDRFYQKEIKYANAFRENNNQFSNNQFSPQTRVNYPNIEISTSDYNISIKDSEVVITSNGKFFNMVKEKVKEWEGGLIEKDRCDFFVKKENGNHKYVMLLIPPEDTAKKYRKLTKAIMKIKEKYEKNKKDLPDFDYEKHIAELKDLKKKDVKKETINDTEKTLIEYVG